MTAVVVHCTYNGRRGHALYRLMLHDNNKILSVVAVPVSMKYTYIYTYAQRHNSCQKGEISSKWCDWPTILEPLIYF